MEEWSLRLKKRKKGKYILGGQYVHMILVDMCLTKKLDKQEIGERERKEIKEQK